MYVAGREITVQGRKVLPGESVPEAASWPAVVQYAHLSNGTIRKAEDIKTSAGVKILTPSESPKSSSVSPAVSKKAPIQKKANPPKKNGS